MSNIFGTLDLFIIIPLLAVIIVPRRFQSSAFNILAINTLGIFIYQEHYLLALLAVIFIILKLFLKTQINRIFKMPADSERKITSLALVLIATSFFLTVLVGQLNKSETATATDFSLEAIFILLFVLIINPEFKRNG